MNARTTVSRVVVLTLLLWAACPSPAPPVTTCGRTAQMMDHTFTLEADPAVVDQVEFVRRGLPIAYRAMAQVGPGKWIYRMGFTYGSRGHRIRYWFRVHRKDLGRWIKISDPRARLLDASVERASLFHVRQDKLTPPPPLKKMPRVRDLIIYELCPREFVSSATPYAHPARAPNARGPGKVFKKITKKIRSGYFNRLGVNALQLMPITASGWTTHKRKTPERDPWGYIPISWYALNGDYGSPRDLVELVTAAHARDIAVLLDMDGDGKTPDLLCNGGQQTSRLGAVLLATVPGAVMIFAGQEHGAADDLKWAHDPLNWQAADRVTLAHYRRLLNLRKDTPALRSDDLRVLVNDTGRHLLIYSRGRDARRADDDTVVVALNFGDRALAGVEVELPSKGAWRDLLTGKALPAGRSQKVNLPASGWAVLGRQNYQP